MLEKVMKTIVSAGLFRQGDLVLVAVSGGPDSLSLLHVLHNTAGQLGIDVRAVHVHHGLRPEAGREAVELKKLCILLGIPLSICRVSVKEIQGRTGLSLQEAARVARYSCLNKVAQRTGARVVATAHHRDDTVETLLYRLLSGAGLDGLAGIPVKRKLHSGVTVVRPFYHITRAEIELYCRAAGLHPLRDPSNEQTDYLRNKVRLQLLPYLEENFGCHVRKALARTAETLAEDRELIARVAEDAFLSVNLSSEPNVPVLERNGLQRLPLPLQARVLRHAFWNAGVGRHARIHIEQALRAIQGNNPSCRIPLPGKVAMVREYDRILFAKNKGHSRTGAAQRIPLLVPGVTCLPWSGEVIEARIIPSSAVRLPLTDRNKACLDAEKAGEPLTVRTRLPGDRIWPLGSKGRKKVKDLLVDRKVPRAKRDLLPLVCRGEEILWCGGVEMSELCRITDKTENVLLLTLKKRDGAQ